MPWLLWALFLQLLLALLTFKAPGNPQQVLELIGSNGFGHLLTAVQYDDDFVEWARGKVHVVRHFFCRNVSKDWIRRTAIFMNVHPDLSLFWSGECMMKVMRLHEHSLPLLTAVANERAPILIDEVSNWRFYTRSATYLPSLLNIMLSKWGSIPNQEEVAMSLDSLHIGGLRALYEHPYSMNWYELLSHPKVFEYFPELSAPLLLRPLLIVSSGMKRHSQRNQLSFYSLNTILSRWLRVEWLLWRLMENYDRSKLEYIRLLFAWIRHLPKVKIFEPLSPLWTFGIPPFLSKIISQNSVLKEDLLRQSIKLPYHKNGGTNLDGYIALFKLIQGDNVAANRDRLRFLVRFPIPGRFRLLAQALSKYNPEDLMDLLPLMEDRLKTEFIRICTAHHHLWDHLHRYHPHLRQHITALSPEWRLTSIRSWMQSVVPWHKKPLIKISNRTDYITNTIRMMARVVNDTMRFNRAIPRHFFSLAGTRISVARLYAKLQRICINRGLLVRGGRPKSRGDVKLLDAMGAVLAMAIIVEQPINLDLDSNHSLSAKHILRSLKEFMPAHLSPYQNDEEIRSLLRLI